MKPISLYNTSEGGFCEWPDEWQITGYTPKLTPNGVQRLFFEFESILIHGCDATEKRLREAIGVLFGRGLYVNLFDGNQTKPQWRECLNMTLESVNHDGIQMGVGMLTISSKETKPQNIEGLLTTK